MPDKTINLMLFVAAVAVSACNSNPTVSSSAIPAGSPPPPSPPAGASSPAPSSPPGPDGQAQTPSTADAEQENASASGAQQGADNKQPGAKTDEQILAEALDEFARKNTQGEHDGNRRDGRTAATDAEQGAATDAEKTAELDRRLGDKFARFDDLILAERKAASRSGNGNGSDDFGDSDEVGDDRSEPLQTAAVEQPQAGRSGGLPRTNRLPTHSVTSKPPADVGDGQDDDIIARQLREAAMKEQDPELRAKLWDEYRKYKKSS